MTAVVSFFRELYSLDTLDTRFTNSPSIPPRTAKDSQSSSTERDRKNVPADVSPSRWRTPEFYFYGLVFLFCVPQMYWAVVQVSQPDSPNYSKYQHLLSPGWLFGRQVDNSDAQYAGFRDNVPYLAILVFLHPMLRRLYEHITLQSTATEASPVSQGQAQARLDSRLRFDFFFSLVFISALVGVSALKILIILFINFKIGTALPRNAIPVATWVFNVGILFANEMSQGFRFSSLSTAIESMHPSVTDWAKALDSFGGIMPRWEVLFKITVLRMISFNFDHYWSLQRARAGSPLEKQLDPSALSERDRVSIPAPAPMFTSFRTYLAYILYPPLYLAGPILTFNDYISQSTYQIPSVTARRTTLYGIRFLATLFCMEFLIHTTYVVAISKSSPDWSTYTPFQLAMLAYFNLHIIWLKLMIPWRFFRLWALVDGIDPPENMVRCMSDNYSALAFWRAWHRSFNRWITRYVYIPLGGGPGGGAGQIRGTINMMTVFTFVALWHDINLRLLMWGWLATFFIIPEVIGGLLFPKSKWKNRPEAYRVLSGIGAVFNILLLMTANLVGFALGLDGLMGLVHGIIGSWRGAMFMLGACGALFVGVQVMFEHREEEKRNGIRLKC